MSKKQRKNYTRDFKIEAVKLVSEHGYKTNDAAERLGICPSALSKWKRELSLEGGMEEAFPGKGYLKPADAKLKSLEKELEKTRRERDILKKALAYFASPLE